MGWFGDPMNTGAGNRGREGKVERSGRKMLPTVTGTGSHHKAEKKDAAAAERKQKRKDKRAAKPKSWWS